MVFLWLISRFSTWMFRIHNHTIWVLHLCRCHFRRHVFLFRSIEMYFLGKNSMGCVVHFAYNFRRLEPYKLNHLGFFRIIKWTCCCKRNFIPINFFSRKVEYFVKSYVILLCGGEQRQKWHENMCRTRKRNKKAVNLLLKNFK